MRQDKIIRVRDKVRIIKPEFFVRCGYPMDIQREAAQLQQELFDDFRVLMQKVGINGSLYAFTEQTYRSYSKICHELAYAKCRTNNFGGNERQIYRESIPIMADTVCSVLDTKIVKTGIYKPKFNCHSYEYGVDECDPAELTNQQTHKLVKVYSASPYFEGWIEAVNVEKCL